MVKNNKTKVKVKTKAKKAGPRPARKSVTLEPLVHQVCSLTNPFCPVAWGARWPDNSMTRSVGYSFKAYEALGTSASGHNSALFCPGLGDMYEIQTGITSGVATFVTLADPGGVALPSNIGRWRITSVGVQISCTSTRLNTQGTLTLRVVSPFDGGTLASMPMEDMLCDEFMSTPISRLIEKDLFVNLHPIGTDARLYRDVEFPVAALSGWKNAGWQCVQISITGGQASISEVLRLKFYVNYEFVFDDASASHAFSKPPPRSSPAARQANAGVLESTGNFLEGTANAVDKVFKSKAFHYASSLAATMAGGPAAGAGVYALTMD